MRGRALVLLSALASGSRAERDPPVPLFMMSAMLDPEKWDEHLRLCRVLVHVAPEGRVPEIQSSGLRPGSEIGVSTFDGFFSARPGHSYLIEFADWLVVELGAEPRVFRVDAAMLDPCLIDPDEDIVAERFPEMVSIPPPRRELHQGVEAPGQDGARARWANTTPNFDRSAVTERSLFEGRRISYRGLIPIEALTLLDIRSPALNAFVQGLEPHVILGLPAVPPETVWRVEIARSRALVTATVRGIAAEIGSSVEVRAGDPYELNDTCNRLRVIVRSLYQMHGRFPEGDAMREGQTAISWVRRFTGLGAVSDRAVAIEVASRAARSLNALASVPGASRDHVRSIAREAFRAAVAAR